MSFRGDRAALNGPPFARPLEFAVLRLSALPQHYGVNRIRVDEQHGCIGGVIVADEPRHGESLIHDSDYVGRKFTAEARMFSAASTSSSALRLGIAGS